jgi:hypothetical protein
MTTNLPPAAAALPARGTISKSLIRYLRAYSIGALGTPDIGQHIEELLIVAAIVSGQHEGRLMTATDIAAFIGLPRSTVIRKLRAVAARRKVVRVRDGARVCYYIAEITDPMAWGAVQRSVREIINSCREVSTLDTSQLDSIPGTDYPRE